MDEEQLAENISAKLQKIDPAKKQKIALALIIVMMIIAIVFIYILHTNVELLRANPCQLCENAGFACTKLMG